MQRLRTLSLNILTRFVPKCLPQVTNKNISAAFIQPIMHFSSLCGYPATTPSFLSARIPTLMPTCGFKVKGRLRRRCKDCYFVVRQERLHVICPTFPRHKQMAMQRRPLNTWILTHATQGKKRAW